MKCNECGCHDRQPVIRTNSFDDRIVRIRKCVYCGALTKSVERYEPEPKEPQSDESTQEMKEATDQDDQSKEETKTDEGNKKSGGKKSRRGKGALDRAIEAAQ